MSWRLEPRFIEGGRGRLYLTEWVPARPSDRRPLVVVVPPFAEEMNRARRMFALQARLLADRGIGTVVFDLFGTGDSEGDFGDASWEDWCEDTVRVCGWARERAGDWGLIALRSGALLAAEVGRCGVEFRKVVLWAPIIEGRAILRQLMRLHAAAFMNAASSVGGGTEELQRRIAAGHSVEIAGYTISARLAGDLSRARIDGLARSPGATVDWFEIVAGADLPIPPGAERGIAELARHGARVSAHAVHDQPFWSLPEITVAPRLARATADRLVASFDGVN
jgi:exosortase A-associated hydrolase 2